MSAEISPELLDEVVGKLNEIQRRPFKGFRPLGNRLLVRVKPQNEVQINGIFRPDVAVEKPLEGVIVAVGPGRLVDGVRVPFDVQKGQTIAFGRYSGNEIEVNGEKLLLLQEDEVHGVFEEEDVQSQPE